MSKFVFLDLETQNHPYLGMVASPHCPLNYVVAVGWAFDNGDIHSRYFNNKEEALQSNWGDLLNTAEYLVAHNATYEITWLLSTEREAFEKFLKRGGKIFCTQAAEYFLTNQTTTYATLNECSLKYGGTQKIDEVSLLWKQGILTADINKDLILRYLAGEGGDIANTRKVFVAQYKQMQERGILDMFNIRMDSLLFNAYATFNGLHVNMGTAHKQAEVQNKRIKELELTLQDILPKDLPEGFTFNFGSSYHRSGLIFGGGVGYTGYKPYDPPKYEQIICYKTLDGTYIPITDPTEDTSNFVQYASGKNKGMLKEFKIDSTVPKLKRDMDAIYRFEGLLKFEELPEVVREDYIGTNAEFKGKQNLRDGSPVYSTSGDSLELLATHTTVAKPFAELASLVKDTSTYYLVENYDEAGNLKTRKGMLQFVGDDGIIHHQLNGTSTITGRLSASKPNMQNLPRGETSAVKKMFNSRFEDGYIIEVDYSALEVVTLAAISNDKGLLTHLMNGTDMHCLRLSENLGESYESVLEKCQDHNHPDHKEYKSKRTAIKAPSFAAQYGASARGIAYATGCTVAFAEAFLANEEKLFPNSFGYKKYVRSRVEETGRNNVSREQHDNGHYVMYRTGYFEANSGTRYSFREYAKQVQRETVMDYSDTQLANYWCQGEASFIVQAACGYVIRHILGLPADLQSKIVVINTVHDAIYLDVQGEDTANEVGKYIAAIMADTPKRLCEVLPKLKEWRYDVTPFPAVAEYGKTMYDKTLCE